MPRLLPALAIALILAACGGGGPQPADLTPGPPTTDLHLKARGMKFDQRALAAPARTGVSLTFSNEDSGVLHNVAIYRDKSAKEKVYATPLMGGKKVESYEFETPGPGQYYFRCDAHPDMHGTLFVQ
ncbi:MAG TPA: cupredoxin domain-containing protein [Dehalococcoidia bacterium]|nr:cupredoxin domain-containing protein [Dehalococcoidia bacterium]